MNLLSIQTAVHDLKPCCYKLLHWNKQTPDILVNAVQCEMLLTSDRFISPKVAEKQSLCETSCVLVVVSHQTVDNLELSSISDAVFTWRKKQSLEVTEMTALPLEAGVLAGLGQIIEI